MEEPPIPEFVKYVLRTLQDYLQTFWVLIMSPGILGKKMWGAGTMWGGPKPWSGWESAKVRFWISIGFWVALYAPVIIGILIIDAAKQ